MYLMYDVRYVAIMEAVLVADVPHLTSFAWSDIMYNCLNFADAKQVLRPSIIWYYQTEEGGASRRK